MDVGPRISLVAGARPNFMKIAPVWQALRDRAEVRLVHTGQHYDHAMSAAFFHDLGLPEPDANLGVGSGTHAQQTADVMVAYEPEVITHEPDAVVVVGDVNSTLAAALVATKLGVPVAHVEAGLRSHDWSMPEEVNRVVTDRIATWLFTPSEEADENLRAEGVSEERISFVGNVMIDTMLKHLPESRERGPALVSGLGLDGDFLLLTLHRPANVDDPNRLGPLLDAVAASDGRLPVVFPAHPRTAAQLGALNLPPSMMVVEPFGYIDFIGLLTHAKTVVSDSGGIQEEASVLGVPCLTLRDNTERPITITLGTNRLIGTNPAMVTERARQALQETWIPAKIPLWDGKAGERIAERLITDLC